MVNKLASLRSVKAEMHATLDSIYGESEVESIFKLLASKLQGIPYNQVSINLDSSISDKNQALYGEALARLLKEEPIQYIIGECEFYGLTFHVNPSVLIPRPETEELVDLVIKDLGKGYKGSIVDLGTGSGCIPIAIKKHLSEATVAAVDISVEALQVTASNAINNEVMIELLPEDMAEVPFSEFDVFISNPPYIGKEEAEEMKNNVLKFEPWLALFSEDPLYFYKLIADKIVAEKKIASVYLELNPKYSEETAAYYYVKGFSGVEVINDFYERPRILKAKYQA